VKKFGPRLPNFFVRGIKGSTGGGKANQGVGKENFVIFCFSLMVRYIRDWIRTLIRLITD
jgi:hypothetical protein